jgi:tetratricopeptide (TPR) repeat protein
MNKLLIIAFLIALIVPSACGPSQKELDRQKEKAVEEKIKEEHRLNGLNYFTQLADLMYNTKKFKNALIYIDSALNFASIEKGELNYKKGSWLLMKRKYDDAIPCYTIAIEKSYDLRNSYYQRALCYEKKRKLQLAVNDLKGAIKLGNNHAKLLHEKINPELKRVSYYVTRCCDGTTSDAKGRGACSRHGGVCNWNEPVYEKYRKY